MVALLVGFGLACREDAAPGGGPPSAPAARPAADQVAAAPAIVFLGDSLTAGFGLSEREALPALIEERLQGEGRRFQVINAGRSGDTTAGGLARIDWYLRDSIPLHTLVIGLGSNDAMRGLPIESMEDNLVQIIRRTRERKPGAKILLWELRTFPNLGAEYARAYAAVFPRVAERENAALVPFPLEAVAAQPELNQADGIHPNAEGTRRVADRVWAALRPVL